MLRKFDHKSHLYIYLYWTLLDYISSVIKIFPFHWGSSFQLCADILSATSYSFRELLWDGIFSRVIHSWLSWKGEFPGLCSQHQTASTFSATEPIFLATISPRKWTKYFLSSFVEIIFYNIDKVSFFYDIFKRNRRDELEVHGKSKRISLFIMDAIAALIDQFNSSVASRVHYREVA